ncbi:hypothetical protein Ddye_015501 [Dipteronia dyeriana]|uniref:Uncharacterized protein n=1 Tax=Dipteronia dyeriana TaxID=168575 RepID=A0AAD9U5E0_9ROSI|nr:hypothetical protein Ddye_015501 [Dipteronia dyeriana]
MGLYAHTGERLVKRKRGGWTMTKRGVGVEGETLKMEKEFRERNQRIKERKNQERIINTDLNKLQPVLRVAYEKMQAQIMKEWERNGLLGDVFDC